MAKRTFVIDMQKHYIPSEARQLVKKTSEYDFTIGLRRFTRAYQIMTDIDIHLEWMDACGIDMGILSTAAFSANGLRFCKACNDGYSKVIQKHPDRFKGVVHVYPFDKGKVRDEIKR